MQLIVAMQHYGEFFIILPATVDSGQVKVARWTGDMK